MLLRIARASVVVACAFLLTLAIIPLAQAPVAHAQDDEELSDAREGIREYKKGNWEAAIRKFDEVLANDPTDEQAKKLRDEIGIELAEDFLRAKFQDPTLTGRYNRFGKWLLASRQKMDPRGRNNNPEEIREYVDAYFADRDIGRKLLRAQSIRDSYGDFAVPYIQAKYMHADSADWRYEARNLLRTLGAQAVNALVQCMYSDELYDRQTAALALGDIADARALPVLAKHFQDAEEDEQVREACRAGIQNIRSAGQEKDKQVNDAKDLYYMQADGYYRNAAAGGFWRNRLIGGGYQGNLPIAMVSYDRRYTAWKWIPEKEAGEGESKLTPQDVPLWAYADIVAEESALEAIALGVKYAKGENDNWVRDAEALLACVRVHMNTEARARYYLGDDTERQFIIQMLGENGFVPELGADSLAAASGGPVLYRALERSLADGYPAVSIALCDLIAALNDGSVVGTNAAAPLIRALADPDKNVRYAAARTLLSLAGDKDTGHNPEVVATAVMNLQEVAARTVLVIMEDEALRNRYLSDLTSLGYAAVGARTLEEGADLATQGTPWDAIVLQGEYAMGAVSVFEAPNISGASDRAEKAVPIMHLLSSDIRSQGVPVLVAVPAGELDSRKSELSALNLSDNRFVTYQAEAGYTVDAEALSQSLDAAWEESVENAKGKTNESVVMLAHAIAGLNATGTKFNIQALLEGLSGGLRLEGRTSAARQAICAAIGNLVRDGKRLGAPWARENIVPNLLDTIGSDDRVDRPGVKAAAARALGATYGTHRGAWDEDGYNALTGMLRISVDLAEITDADQRMAVEAEVYDARQAAGEAFGRAPTTAAQRMEFQRAQAVNRHAPHPDSRTAGE